MSAAKSLSARRRSQIIGIYIAGLSFVLGLVVAGLMNKYGHAVSDSHLHHITNFAPVPKPDAVPTGRISLAPGQTYSTGGAQ